MSTLPNSVERRRVETARIETHYLESGDEDGEPVVFLHGNASSSRFYGELLAALPERYRGIAPDFRGFGRSERQPIDATRGLRDFADDIEAFRTALGIDTAIVGGWSTGGGVAMRYAIENPGRVDSLFLINPVSPYGFGGTRRDGTPCQPDYAGTGGGLANDEFVESIDAGDTTAESDASPRNVLRAFYTAPGTELDQELEDAYVDAILETETGEGYYPGDSIASDHWPNVAPGDSGVNNALSPKYCELTALVDIETKPPVLWIRGAEDMIVADESFFDAGYLGKLGEIPGWPGEGEFPPQPMVTQTRDVLSEYEDKEGAFEEAVIEGTGHSPHIEKKGEVLDLLLEHF